MAKFFISYSRVDKDTFTEPFIAVLTKVYRPPRHLIWWDEHLRGGDVWWQEILRQVAECDIFIYLLSNESVTSPYCKAEYAEARRLQKQIITVQVRDRTQITDDLADIQYVDMKRGVDDAAAQPLLFGAINEQIERIPPRKPRALWMPQTPRPRVGDETPRPADAPDVDTPILDTPLLPAGASFTPKTGKTPVVKPSRSRFSVFALVIGGALVILTLALFALNGYVNSQTRSPTPTDDVQVAIVPTDTEQGEMMATDQLTDTAQLTPTPSETLTNTPTATISPTDLPTLDIIAVVATLDAQGTAITAQTLAAATAVARGTSLAQTPTFIAGQTQTADAWTDTPTPNITASIEAYVATRSTATAIGVATQTAEAWTDIPTNTATLTPSNTSTQTDTPLPTDTPRPTDTPIPLGFPGNPVTANDQWTPIEQDFDGVTMVLVPAGCFMMGSTQEQVDAGDADDDELPQNEVCFDEPFWIDKYEVTQVQFREHGGVQAVPSAFTGDNRPVERITWFEARDYCATRGGSLPNEPQWEYAARGPDGLIFPWGDEWVDNSAVHGGNSRRQTSIVGSRPGGVSWVGALDMSGNVWEWVSTIYDSNPETDAFPYPYDGTDRREDLERTDVFRLVRGGSWDFFTNDLSAASRFRIDPNNWYLINGFRCSRSYSSA
jgi:formylglycine-generating enzyme required for sulfatase activity